MKKFNRVLASLGAMAMLAWGGVFTSCGSDDDSGPSFTAQIKIVSAEDLGAAASAVSSSDEKIAKAEVADGAVKITSVKEGTATVTATASGYTNATIPVTVANNGAITVGSVTKFEKEASGTLNSVSITGAEIVQYNAADIKYTATADASENASVTYAWTVTADEGLVTAKSGEATGELTLTVNNTAAEEKTFTVKVTATCGSTSKEASKTVKVSALGEEVKNEVTGVSISASGQTESGVTIAADGSLVLTAVETKTGNPTLTYAWEVTDTENLLASKSGENTSALTITANNSTIFEKTVTVKVTVSDGTNSKDATITVSVKGKDGAKTIWDFSKSDASGTGASAWNGVPKPAAQGSALVTRAENSYTGYLGRKFWLVNGVYAEYRSNGLGYTNSANDATHESADFVKAIETEALTGPFVLNVTSGTANDARIFKIYMSTDKATLWDEANVKVSGKLEKKAYTVEKREASQVYVGIGTLPSTEDKKVYTSITKIELVADAEIPMDKFKAKDFSVKFADEAVTFTDNAASLSKSPANNGEKILVETDPAYATGANVTFAYTATTGSDVSINANGKEASLVIADGITATNTGVIKITVTDDSGTSLEKNITLTVTATVSDADKVAAAKADITTALTGENNTFVYMGTSVAVANATAVVNAATIRYKDDVTITYNTPSTAEPNLVVTVKLNEASDTVTYNFAEKYGVDNQLTAAVKALKALPAYTWAGDADATVTAINGAITDAVTKYDVTVTAVKTSSVKVTTTVTSAIDGGKKKELVVSPYYTELFEEETSTDSVQTYGSGVTSTGDTAKESTVAEGSGYTPKNAVKIANNLSKYISVPVYGNCDIVLVHVADGKNERGIKASIESGTGTIEALSATAFAYDPADKTSSDTVAVKTAADKKSAYATVYNTTAKVSSVLTFTYTGSAGRVKLQNTKADMTSTGGGGIYIYAIDVKRSSAIKFSSPSQNIGQGKSFDASTLLVNSGSDPVTYALAEGTAAGITISGSTVSVAADVAINTSATVIATAGSDTAKLTLTVVEYIAVDSVKFMDKTTDIYSLKVVVGKEVDLNTYLKVSASDPAKTPTNPAVTWSVKTPNTKITLDTTTGKVTVASDASTAESSEDTAVFTATSVDDNSKSADITITADKVPSVAPISFDVSTSDSMPTWSKGGACANGTYDGVTVVDLKYANSSTKMIELTKSTGTASFEVAVNATITITMASTGNGNTSSYTISGAGISKTGSVTGSALTEISDIKSTEAGKITITAGSDRNLRLQKITVTY